MVYSAWNVIRGDDIRRAVLAEPRGVVVNIASALGGCTGFSVYSASKAGLIGFTQSYAWELAPRRIRVVGSATRRTIRYPLIH